MEGKGGEGRVVPINTAAREEILKLAKKAKGKYLFHDGHGRPIADIRKAFDQAVKKAGLEDVHFHDLRRTFGTECVLKGVPAKTLQKWMGHKSIKTTMKYYVSIPDAYEQEAIKRLDGMCDTQTDTWENVVLKEGEKSLEKIGGAEGDRTLGLMTASHALSQLSYSPTRFQSQNRAWRPFGRPILEQKQLFSKIARFGARFNTLDGTLVS